MHPALPHQGINSGRRKKFALLWGPEVVAPNLPAADSWPTLELQEQLKNPRGMALSPDERLLYVVNNSDRSLSVLAQVPAVVPWIGEATSPALTLAGPRTALGLTH